MYSINFIVANKNFCLSLHCNGDSRYLFVNCKEMTFQKTFLHHKDLKLDYLDIFMNLVLITGLLQMITY